MYNGNGFAGRWPFGRRGGVGVETADHSRITFVHHDRTRSEDARVHCSVLDRRHVMSSTAARCSRGESPV